jgi:organic hydroperoxide reductase OsmC/OhrA
MAKTHEYPSRVVWTGNTGAGTSSYKSYERSWDMAIEGKETVHCSNDPFLGGEPSKYNPEDMLITALSSCHMLWYLHLCSQAKITVLAYEDNPVGIGASEPDGSGQFSEAILRPKITITADSDADKAVAIHDKIHNYCFIARSVNFPVKFEVEVNKQT